MIARILDDIPKASRQTSVGGRAVVDGEQIDQGISTPYLQLVLETLWKTEQEGHTEASFTLRLVTLERLGGVDGIVRAHVRDELGGLEAGQQELAAAAFRELVTPSGQRIALTVSDLVKKARDSGLEERTRVDDEEMERLLVALADRPRIVRRVASPGRGPRTPGGEDSAARDRQREQFDDHFEIYHDALADAVLAWSQEREAEHLARSREQLVWSRVRKWSIPAIVLFAVVFVLAVRAEQQRLRAEEQGFNAQTQQAIAEEQRSDARTQQAIAEKQRGDARTQQAITDEQRRIAVTQETIAKTAVADARTSEEHARIAQGEAVTAKQTADIAGTMTSRISTSRALLIAALSSLVVDPERSILLALQALDGPGPQIEAQEALYRALHESRARQRLGWEGGQRIDEHTAQVNGLAYSRDGDRIVTVSQDGTARVWTLSPGDRPVPLNIPEGEPKLSVAVHPDGELIAIGDDGGKIWICNLRTRDVVQEIATRPERQTPPNRDAVFALDFSVDGRFLASGHSDGSARIWRTGSWSSPAAMLWATNVPTDEPAIPAGVWDDDRVLSLDFSQDGQRLITGHDNGYATIWTLGNDLQLRQQRHVAPTQRVRAVAFEPSGGYVATGTDQGPVRIWDARTGAEVLALPGHKGGTRSLAFSRRFRGDELNLEPEDGDPSWLVSGGIDRVARVWDWRAGAEVFTLAGHTGSVMGVAFSPRGTPLGGLRIATASSDRSARIWDATLPFQHHAPARDVTFSPDGRFVGTTGTDGTARIWDAESGALIRTLCHFEQGCTRGSRRTVNRIVFNHDGSRVATASSDAAARVWDPATGEVKATMPHTDEVDDVAFDPINRSLVATASRDGRVRIWDLSLDVPRPSPTGPVNDQGWVTGIAYSPVDRWIATAEFGQGRVRLWDTGNNYSEGPEFRGSNQAVWRVAFSADGTQLAATRLDGTAQIWNLNTPDSPVWSCLAHGGNTNAVAFSSNGRFATGGDDRTAKLWDRGSCGVDLSLDHDAAVNAVAFSGQGPERLATASDDGTARVFLLDVNELIALARQRVTRAFTADECSTYFESGGCPGAP